MTTISSINHAHRQNLTFKANDSEQKKHPVKAVLLYGMPGVGEITNGDTKNGLKHLGAAVAISIASTALYFKKVLPSVIKNIETAGKTALEKGFGKEYLKAAYKGVSKKSMAGMVVLGVLGLVNATKAAIGTYKGKQTN